MSRRHNPYTTEARRLKPLIHASMAESPAASAQAINKIILIPANTSAATVYPKTAAGLTAALAAASSGAVVWVPPCTLAANYTIPAGVGLMARGAQTVINGQVTLGAGSYMHLITVQRSTSSDSAILGVVGPSSGEAILNNCHVDVTNSGDGNGIAVQLDDGDLLLWNCWLEGYAGECGDGFGIYQPAGVSGTVNTNGGRVYGSTAPAAAESYAVGAQLSTGSITVTAETGNTISSLTECVWYAVENTGGPWDEGLGGSNYGYDISDDGGSSWERAEDNPNGIHSPLVDFAAHSEVVSTNYVRVYFKAAVTSIKIRLNDAPGQFGDNTGSLGWKLSEATSYTTDVDDWWQASATEGAQTAEPLEGDKGAWEVADYGERHASDWDDGDSHHAAGSGGIPADGWVDAGETWTYASATTFTISGDLTGKYQSGDKLKLTQTTAKYFYVVTVAHAGGTTTITVTGGSDYTIANAAITSPYYSKLENPQGFPSLFTWTPTITQSGSVTFTNNYSKFQRVGKVVYLWFNCDITGTGTTANDIVIGGLPINNVVSGGTPIGTAFINDNGTAFYVGASYSSSTTNITIRAHLETNDVGSDPSFALASGDSLRLFAVYPVA